MLSFLCGYCQFVSRDICGKRLISYDRKCDDFKVYFPEIIIRLRVRKNKRPTNNARFISSKLFEQCCVKYFFNKIKIIWPHNT